MLKTLRDIRETIGSFISILIIIFIGNIFFAGIVAASRSVTNLVEDYYVSQNLASSRAEYMYVNSTAVEEIKGRPGVKAAAGYDTFYTQSYPNGVRYDMTITTLTPGIDEPHILRGAMPQKDKREIIIDSVFADARNVKVGDRLDFKINALKSVTVNMSGADGTSAQYTPEYESVPYTFTVSGIFHAPDVIFKVNVMNTAAKAEDFIMAYVNYGEIKSYVDDAAVLFGKLPVFSYASVPSDIEVYKGVKVIGDIDGDAIFKEYSIKSSDELAEIFKDPSGAAGLYMYTLEKKNYPTVVAYKSINDTIAALAAVLPFIFFAVAVAITVISMSKTVDNQRMQIGVIQALGLSKGSVYFSYMFYALFASVIGGFAGGIVGTYTIPYLLLYIYEGQFHMPPYPLKISILYMFLGVAISAALACLAALVSCYKTLKVAPAQAMRPKPPKKTKKILAERWTGLWSRLGFGAKMNLRNMFLHKLRMLLSSVGIVGCLALLVGLMGLKDNMAFSLDSYNKSAGYDMTIVTDVAVDITPDSPIYDAIAGAEGVEYMHNLTFVPTFSAKFEYAGKKADQTLMALPTYADEKYYRYANADCVKLYSDINGKNRILFDNDTLVLPEMLANDIGAKAGDKVKITGYTLTNKPVEFELTVTAIAYEYFDQKAYCAYDVFLQNDIELVANTSYASLLPGKSLGDAINTLENNESVRAVQTFSETFEALENRMKLLDYAVVIFVVGAAALAVAVIYNITATNLKERTREIATLMVLGYKRGETASMIIVENMVITLLGCALGLPLGYGLLVWLVDLTKSFKVFISGFFSWYIALGCVAMTFAFSLIATLLLNTRMKKISMVEALKSVE